MSSQASETSTHSQCFIALQDSKTAEEQLERFNLIGRFKGGILLHDYVTKLDYVLRLEVYDPRLDDLFKRNEIRN
ncbi:hypothetical protein LWI28_003124 [Acer negundo]|uniref:Uncharacterized protein n=1 Tax=Acer negundo TaxID=4023 RepID=A0AAD5ICM7_ACENE|nr:hypothetical protein LWI28_003124 [Acer negundo]